MSQTSSVLAPAWPSGVAVSRADLAQLRSAGEGLRMGSSGRVGTLLAGAHRSPFRGRGVEFAEVREYHAGDDPRSIDWRVTARTGQVHTKLFHEERERPVLFLVDLSSTMRFGTRRCFKSVLAAQLTALLGSAALAAGDRVGGVVLGDQSLKPFRALRTRRRWMAFLDTVAVATQQPPFHKSLLVDGPTLDQAMRRLRLYTSPGCQVVLISDFYQQGSNFETAFRLLAKRTDLHLIHAIDPLEQAAPPRGRYRIADGIKLAVIDTANSRSQQLWSQQIQQRQQFLQQLCSTHDANYLLASTAIPALETLTSGLQSRRK